MSPVERLQAAIDRLTELRDKSTPGPWKVDWCPGTAYQVYTEAESVFGGTVHTVDDSYPRGGYNPFVDAELIATLHCTIDAQITILQAAHDDFIQYGAKPSKFFENDAALADAILGVTA